MSQRRRVVVTGVGAITPIGITERGLWDGLRAGRSAVRTVTRFDPTIFRSHNAAEVTDFVATDFLEAKRAKRLDRFGQFSVAAARLALEDARLDPARGGCAPSTRRSPSPSSAARRAATSPSSSACRGRTARTR